ncbi:MAG: hypothetical protein JF606_23845 [Burkholderiales bacterium]|nr:hypothetical protein [Burkholderiales bacterium]
MSEADDRHFAGLGPVVVGVVRMVVNRRGSGQQVDVVGVVLHAAFPQLLQVHEHAVVTLAQRKVEAQVRAKHEVRRIMAQPVLSQSNLGPE